MQSVQGANGNLLANAVVNVSNDSGVTNMTTAATGNSGANDGLGYADLTGNVQQTTGAVTIDAEGQLNASQAQSGALNANVQAVGNSQSIGTVGGSATMTVNQSNQATVIANGGAELNYTGDQGIFTAVTTGNNVTGTGTNGTTTALAITQSNTGSVTQAAQFTDIGNGQTIVGSANAIANNVSITNENNPLNVTTNQNNTSYVLGLSEASVYEFGSATASASGVGNSAVVGNVGGDLTLNNNQVNTGGGIEALSSFSGNNGYDANASATAMGNAVTGYACSTCKSKVTVTNRQTSSADVSATSTLTVASQNRSVTGVSTAIGNTATFYVSEPSD